MALYPYVATLAVDPQTLEKAAGATGVIYAPEDTSFASPLTATDETGNPIPLTSNTDGVLPSFYSTAPAVNWRSGSYVFPLVTSMPLPGPQGAPGDPGRDGVDGSNVVPTAAAIAAEIQTPGTPANTALSATVAEKSPLRPRVPGVHYLPIQGVIRKSGGAWTIISDSLHAATGIASIEATSTYIRVHFTAGATKIGAVIAAPDETYAAQGLIMGSSVAEQWMDIYVYRQMEPIGGYVTYNGTDFVCSPSDQVTGMVWTAGNLAISHKSVAPTNAGMVVITPREDPTRDYRLGSFSNILTNVKVYSNGTAVSTPDTSMRFAFQRDSRGWERLDPTTMTEGLSNIWISGFLEVRNPD